MSGVPETPAVGLVVVSHAASVASGVADLAAQMAGPQVRIEAAGGTADGRLGTDPRRLSEILTGLVAASDVVVLVDIGSSVLAARAAIAGLPEEVRGRVAIADAPLVEGAVAAGVIASTGAPLADVLTAAEEARDVRKL